MGYSRRLMRSTKTLATQTCAICERTLLVGERTTRFAPEGEDFVDVCPLCQELAAEQGWLKEGSPTTPTFAEEPRRKRFSLASFLDPRRADPEDTLAPEPILRRLSDHERAMVEAADLFNASPYRRTVGGIAKSLGKPHVSVVPLSGVNRRSSSPSRGTSPGTSTASSPTRRSPCGSPSEATSWRSSSRRSGRGTRASTRTAAWCRRSLGSSAARSTDLQSEDDDLLRDPARARGRALRQDGRVLQGQPERDRHRRPPRGARPPKTRPAETGGKRETRDRRRPRIPGTFLEAEGEPEAAD